MPTPIYPNYSMQMAPAVGNIPQQPLNLPYPINPNGPMAAPPPHPAALLDALQSFPLMLNRSPLQQAYKETMARLLNDPEKRNQILALGTKMQTGQIMPEEAIKQMTGLLTGAMPGTQNPGSSLGALVISAALGIPVITLINKGFHNLEESNNSTLAKILTNVEKVPGVTWLNKHLENYLSNHSSPWAKRLFAEDIRTWDQLRSNFTSKYLGPKGVYNNNLINLQRQLKMLVGAPSIDPLFKRLREANKLREIEMLFSPDIKHFLPYHLEKAGASVTGKTLEHVDDLILRNRLIEDVGQAAYRNAISHVDGRQVLEALRETSQPVLEQLPKLLNDEQLGKKLQAVWKLNANPSIEEVRTALNFKPFNQYLNEVSEGLLFNGKQAVPLNAKMTDSIEHIAERLNRYHISNQMNGISQWGKLQGLLSGFRSRLSFIERDYVPYAISEQNFFRRMKDLHIGPVGRLLGKASFALEKMFTGQSFEAWGLKSLSGAGRNWRKYIAVSFSIFGISALLSTSSSKEARFSRLTDSIASGFGLYFGFEVTKNLLSQLSLLESRPFLARLSAKRLFKIPFLMQRPVTVGGFLQRFILPSVMGGLFVPLFKKPTNWLFSDPEKLEAKIKKLKAKSEAKMTPEMKALQEALASSLQPAPQPSPYAMAPMPPQSMPPMPYWPNYGYPSYNPMQQQAPAISPLTAARTAAMEISEQAPKILSRALPGALMAAKDAKKAQQEIGTSASASTVAYVDDLGSANSKGSYPSRITHANHQAISPDLISLAKDINRSVI